MQVKISDLRSMPFDQVESHFASLQQECGKGNQEKAVLIEERDQAIRDRTIARQQNQVLTEVESLSSRIVAIARQTQIEPTRRERIIRTMIDMTRALKQAIHTIHEAIKQGIVQACQNMYDSALKICNFLYDHALEIFCVGSIALQGAATVASIGFLIFSVCTGNFTALAVNPFDQITI